MNKPGNHSAISANLATPSQLAAAQNFDEKWFRNVELCGFSVVIAIFDCRPGSPVLRCDGQKTTPDGQQAVANLGEVLGTELEQLRLGHLDSSLYPGLFEPEHSGFVWDIFYVVDFQRALIHLKHRLAELGLLGHSKLLHAEGPNQFAIWASLDVDEIGKTMELPAR